MRFLVDESADARLAAHLGALGHDAVFIVRSHGPGLTDDEILAVAHAEGRVLITDDRDFGDLVFRLGRPHSGVIFLRLRTTVLEAKIRQVNETISRYGEGLDRLFAVVGDRAIRVRGSLS